MDEELAKRTERPDWNMHPFQTGMIEDAPEDAIGICGLTAGEEHRLGLAFAQEVR